MKNIISFLKKDTYKKAAVVSLTAVILLTLIPGIAKCVSNGVRSKHLNGLYMINYAITNVLEEESRTGYDSWHTLVEENDSGKLLNKVSAAFFDGKIHSSDYYAESDGIFLRLSSRVYPEMRTLKIKIPEIDQSLNDQNIEKN